LSERTRLTAEQLSLILGKGGDVGTLAMKVDSEIHHAWASFLSFVLGARYAVNTGAEARSFMASAPKATLDGGVIDLSPEPVADGPTEERAHQGAPDLEMCFRRHAHVERAKNRLRPARRTRKTM